MTQPRRPPGAPTPIIPAAPEGSTLRDLLRGAMKSDAPADPKAKRRKPKARKK